MKNSVNRRTQWQISNTYVDIMLYILLKATTDSWVHFIITIIIIIIIIQYLPVASFTQEWLPTRLLQLRCKNCCTNTNLLTYVLSVVLTCCFVCCQMKAGRLWEVGLLQSTRFSSAVDVVMLLMVRHLRHTLVTAVLISSSFLAAHDLTTLNISIGVQTLVLIRCVTD